MHQINTLKSAKYPPFNVKFKIILLSKIDFNKSQ